MQNRKNTKQTSSTSAVGALLAKLRRNAQLTQRALAELLCVHEETIASIEQGRRSLLPDLAEQLDRILATGGVLAVAVESAAKSEKGDNFPLRAQEFMWFERKAISLSSYETVVAPGLLQTETYARAVFRTATPAVSEEEVERRVAARLERQAVLHRESPIMANFIVSEAILLSGLGGLQVRRGLLQHMLNCTDLPGISVQVLELSCDSHAGLSGPFVLLETPEHQLLAYTEAQRTSRIIADRNEVSVLAQKYGMLRTQALNTRQTQDLLNRLLGES